MITVRPDMTKPVRVTLPTTDEYVIWGDNFEYGADAQQRQENLALAELTARSYRRKISEDHTPTKGLAVGIACGVAVFSLTGIVCPFGWMAAACFGVLTYPAAAILSTLALYLMKGEEPL